MQTKMHEKTNDRFFHALLAKARQKQFTDFS
jgi:hypothetical protein